VAHGPLAPSPEDPTWRRHRYPATVWAARSAREHLRHDLETAGIGGRTGADAELVLSELVANAVLHGRPHDDGTVEAAWRLDEDRILLSVHDGGRAADLRPGDSTAVESSGRGLALVELMSDRWAWSADGGTRVVAELLLTAAAAENRRKAVIGGQM
jgi:anti-sigma regulatory factor (Ser/Thr protein kinase)